jgi:cytochrome c-type biogenesis protein CcmH
MMLAFVLIAGSLAAGAAVLLLLPLLRRRADAQPVSGISAAVVTVAILLGGAGLYAKFSKYDWVTTGPVGDTPAARAARLAQELAASPDDAQRWMQLGDMYMKIEQFPLAVRAFQRADRLADNQNPDAIMGMAEARLAQDPAEIEGASGRMFERVLELQPGNPKALFYSAFAALVRGELPVARQRFQGMLAHNPPPAVRTIIEQRIAEIDRVLQGGAAHADAAGASADQARIAVRVSLAPELASRIPAGAVLFVAARDPKAPGPPFAAKQLRAQFPVDVELTPADAMLESRRISSGQQLEVVARVALGGTPTATSGDPFGQVSYHVGKDGRLNILIDRLSP